MTALPYAKVARRKEGADLPIDKSVIVEVYPSIFRNRYPRENKTGDQHDAYAVARWLNDMDRLV